MTKASFVIRERDGFKSVEGYLSECGLYGVDKRNGTCQPNKQFWYVTDLASGLGIDGQAYSTRKEAVEAIDRVGRIVTEKGLREKPKYIKACEELNKYLKDINKANTEVKTAKGEKKMAKTNTTKAKAVKPETKAQLKELNEALKREIEVLKAQIESFESAVKVENITIDTFDVEGYMASRDDSARITPELVEALENTKGLTVTRKGKDEWLYVSGATEADTKERKDIFKAMGFRWSANENAWFIAPYPLRSKKAWGAKKARKASANA